MDKVANTQYEDKEDRAKCMTYKDFENIEKSWNGKTCIFGAGLIGRTWGYDVAVAAGFCVDFYCDNNIPAGSIIRDLVKTISVEELYSYQEDVLVLVALKEAYQKEIVEQLNSNGVTRVVMMGDAFVQELFFSLETASVEIKQKYKMLMDDAEFLKQRYKHMMGIPLNLENPQRYNEKLQWLKINDHDIRYTNLVDKYEVKNVIERILGKQYVIPTIGVWDHFDEIDFDVLPKAFVLKCTNDSGSVVVCKDKSALDTVAVRETLEKGLRTNFYVASREYPYKNIKPRIIAEEYIEDKTTETLDDYKFFCFNGIVDNVMVVRERASGNPKFYHFDKEWKLCRFNRRGRSLPYDYVEEKPDFIDEMIRIAEKLSEDFLHVRIDLYEANGQIYFGEYTFFNQSGWEDGFDEKSDLYLGGLISLPIV